MGFGTSAALSVTDLLIQDSLIWDSLIQGFVNLGSLLSEIIIASTHEALYHMPSLRDGLSWGWFLFLPIFYA